MTAKTSTASRAVNASAWTIGTRLSAKLIDLAMLLCLARFLGPEEFGLVAMAMAAVFIIEALLELPMAAALIRAQTLTSGLLNTAFTLSLLRGAVIALILLAVSWPLSVFNEEPRLRALLSVLALAPAMRGLVSPRMVEYARAFNFRPDAAIEISGKFVAFLLSVVIATTTGSYWAIAAATVGGPLTTTLLSYFVAPLRPRITLVDWSYFSNVIGWNFLSQTAAALNWQIDRLILPRLTSNSVFGQYAMGKQLSEIPVQALVQPLYRPSMTALTSAGENRKSRYLQISEAIVIFMLPVMGIPLLWPEVLVRIALGPSWAQSAEWLRWISAVAVLSLPALMMSPLAMTLDRTRWVAIKTTVELIFRIPFVWFGALAFGVPGAIGGSAIATAIGTIAAMFIVSHLLEISFARQTMILWRPVFAIVPSGLLLYYSELTILAKDGITEVLLCAAIFSTAYVICYSLFILLAWNLAGKPAGIEQHLIEVVRDRFHKKRKTIQKSKIPNVKKSN
ncbi:oligosaccharide flippase family protein [Variovorax sp. RHLX14]|uniref:oligosaccharide flippase family protein n=1 Tax=Variovorax sp. RHLX14 TaxID=1259731 RepID=UPI003F459A6A